MEKYQKGKVYAIICRKTGRRYIGSTAEPILSRRLAKHVSNYIEWLRNGKKHRSSYDIIKDGDYHIILLELFPCGSKDELRMCEQKHIDLYECVNQQKAFRSEDDRLKYIKDYKNENRDEINAKRRERVFCPNCQREMTMGSFYNHKKECKNV
jgi:Zn ribbon nucleic-acid-binding protein